MDDNPVEPHFDIVGRSIPAVQRLERPLERDTLDGWDRVWSRSPLSLQLSSSPHLGGGGAWDSSDWIELQMYGSVFSIVVIFLIQESLVVMQKLRWVEWMEA